MVTTRQIVADIKSILLAAPSTTFKQLPDGGFEFATGTYTDYINPEVLEQVCQPFTKYGRIYDRLLEYSRQPKRDIISQALQKNLRYYAYRYERLILAIPESATLLFVHSYIRPLTEQMCLVDSILVETRKDHRESDGRHRRDPEVDLLDSIHSALCLVTAPHLRCVLASMFVDCCRVYYELLDRWVFEGWQSWNSDFLNPSPGGGGVLDRSAWQDCGVSARGLAELFPKFLRPLAPRVVQCAKTAALVRLCHPRNELAGALSSGEDRLRIKLRMSEAELSALEGECSDLIGRCWARLRLSRSVPGPATPPREVVERERASAAEKFNREREEIQRAVAMKKVVNLDEQRRDMARAVEVRQLAQELQQREDERVRREVADQEAARLARVEHAKKELIEKYRRLNAAAERAQAKAEWRTKRLQLSAERNRILAALESPEAWAMEEEDPQHEPTPGASPSTSEVELEAEAAARTEVSDGPREVLPDGGQTAAAAVGGLGGEGDGLGSDVDGFSDGGGCGLYSEAEAIRRMQTTGRVREAIREEPVENFAMPGPRPLYELATADIPAAGLRSDARSGREARPTIKLTAEAERIKRKIMEAEYGVRLARRESPVPDPSDRMAEVPGSSDREAEVPGPYNGAVEVPEPSKGAVDVPAPFVGAVGVPEPPAPSVEALVSDVAEHFGETVAGLAAIAEEADDGPRLDRNSKESAAGSPEGLSTDAHNLDEVRTTLSKQTGQINSVDEKVSPSGGGTTELGDFDPFGELAKRLRRPRPRLMTGHRDVPEAASPPAGSLDFGDWHHWAVRSLAIPLRTQSSLVEAAAIAMLMDKYSLMTHLNNLRRYFFLMDPVYKMCLSRSLFPTLETGHTTSGSVLPCEAGPHPDALSAAIVAGDEPSSASALSARCLDRVGLRYRVGWPLNLVLTQPTLDKYNVVFRLLVAVQRADWCLARTVLVMKIKAVDVRGHQYRQLQLYRHVMSHYISAVQNYLMNTVLDGCWSAFTTSLDTVKDVDDLYRAHVAYVKDVLFKCLLNKRSSKLREQLIKLLETVYTFYGAMTNGEWQVSGGGGCTGGGRGATAIYMHSRFNRLRYTFRMFLQLAHYITRYVERLVQLGYQAQDLDTLHKSLTVNSFYLNIDIS